MFVYFCKETNWREFSFSPWPCFIDTCPFTVVQQDILCTLYVSKEKDPSAKTKWFYFTLGSLGGSGTTFIFFIVRWICKKHVRFFYFSIAKPECSHMNDEISECNSHNSLLISKHNKFNSIFISKTSLSNSNDCRKFSNFKTSWNISGSETPNLGSN